MRKNISKTAFTLIELIVSTVLVSIVLLGIFAISGVLSNNNEDYGQKFLVKSETQATLNNILGNAISAVGSGTTVGTPPVLDQAILLPANGLANNSFCMHENNGGDTWMCYVLNPDTFQISFCNRAYNLADAAGLRGAGGACIVNTTQFLGTATSVTPTFTDANGQLLFTVTIVNSLNNSIPPATSNPQVTLTGSAYPTQSGM